MRTESSIKLQAYRPASLEYAKQMLFRIRQRQFRHLIYFEMSNGLRFGIDRHANLFRSQLI